MSGVNARYMHTPDTKDRGRIDNSRCGFNKWRTWNQPGCARWMRGGSDAAGAEILFLDFRKLLQHNSEVHFQHLEEVRMNLILDHAFSLRASQPDVSLA